MQTVFHSAQSRGHADHGWLKSHFSFSFADWYNPERMGFGALRVLNDDWIAPQSGFPPHSHQDFEIITIVMKGAVTHEDSMGNRGKVAAGEVQVMSAGTGVTHAEYNHEDESLELFQIWIATNELGASPRYEQKRFGSWERQGKPLPVVSGGDVPETLSIRQDARISLLNLKASERYSYPLREGKGLYVFVVEGEVEMGHQMLGHRDASGVWDAKTALISSSRDSALLLIEVPH